MSLKVVSRPRNNTMSHTSEHIDDNVDDVPDSYESRDQSPPTEEEEIENTSTQREAPDNVQDIAGPSGMTRAQLSGSAPSQARAETALPSPVLARPDPRRVAKKWSGPGQKAVRISTVTPESRRNQRPLIPNPAVSETTSHVVREEVEGDNVTKAEVGEIKDTLSRQGEAIQSVAMAVRDLAARSHSDSHHESTSVASTSKSKAKPDDGGTPDLDKPDNVTERSSRKSSKTTKSSHHTEVREYKYKPISTKDIGPLDEDSDPPLVVINPTNYLYERCLNYRYYRLFKVDLPKGKRHTSDFKDHKKALRSALRNNKFTGEDPILILKFLAEFVRECDAHGISEPQAYNLIPYFMDKQATEGLQSVTDGTEDPSEGGVSTWPQVVYYLLGTYATNDNIAKAVDDLLRLRQKVDESDQAYHERLLKAIA